MDINVTLIFFISWFRSLFFSSLWMILIHSTQQYFDLKQLELLDLLVLTINYLWNFIVRKLVFREVFSILKKFMGIEQWHQHISSSISNFIGRDHLLIFYWFLVYHSIFTTDGWFISWLSSAETQTHPTNTTLHLQHVCHFSTTIWKEEVTWIFLLVIIQVTSYFLNSNCTLARQMKKFEVV